MIRRVNRKKLNEATIWCTPYGTHYCSDAPANNYRESEDDKETLAEFFKNYKDGKKYQESSPSSERFLIDDIYDEYTELLNYTSEREAFGYMFQCVDKHKLEEILAYLEYQNGKS